MKRHSLIFRLLAFTVAAATLPALLVWAAHRSISSRALLKNIRQQKTELARRIAQDVNSKTRHAQSLLALVARSSFFSAGSRVDQYEALRNLLREAPAFQEAMAVGPDGMEILKVSRQEAHPPLFRRAAGLGAPFLGRPFFSGNRAPTILLSEPLRSFANPQRSGAVMAKMSFTSLNELMRDSEVGARGAAFIVDEKGMLLAHPDEALVLSHTSLAALPVVRAWLADPGRPTDLVRYADAQGLEWLSLAHPIPLLNSAVVIQQPRADVYAPLQRMRHQFIAWTAASVGVFIALALAVAWRILKPLRQLHAAAEQVGSGKTDIRLDIRTHDELEELGAAFEKMTRSLATLERMRRDLISMIVHDLKMPLATILPSLESLLVGDRGALSKEQAHFVQMARRSAQEMLMLIQNLLDVARMEEGKLTLRREPFAPADWAQGVVLSFQPIAEASGKRLALACGPDLEAVEGDVPLLSRALGNLISNALRHTPPDTGEIVVTLYRDGRRLAVEVRDNGEGIAHADQARIFERFAQGGAPGAEVRTGAGLGLTFCKMIVEAHGGQITLFSQPQEGSVFTLRLPFPLPPEPVSTREPEALAAPA